MVQLLVKIPGPQFLLIFAVLAIVCIYLAWRRADADGSQDWAMPGPHNLDPVSISLLSGGRKTVIRTVVFDLWNRNLIKIKGDGLAATLEGVPSGEKIGTPVHEAIHRFIMHDLRQPSQLFTDDNLHSEIEAHLEPVRMELRRLSLFQTESDLSRTRFAFWVTLSIIAGFGGTKLFLGISRGKPVAFLVIELVVSLIALLTALRPWALKPTRLGYQYLRRLKKHFGWMQEHLSKKNHYTGIDPVFAVAIFGVSPLLGSPLFDPFGRAFRTGSTGDTLSGSGCGGGCSGGGGGGGCGGCGGCGG